MVMDWIFRGKQPFLGAPAVPSPVSLPSLPPQGLSAHLSYLDRNGGGVLCSIACSIKPKLGYDDSLDVVGVHGVGGTWGALATGLFASKAINAAGNDGLSSGTQDSFGSNSSLLLATWILALVGTYIIHPLLGPLRVSGCLMKKNEWV